MTVRSSRHLPQPATARRGSRVMAFGGGREGIDPAVIEALPTAVVVLDLRGVVVTASEPMAHLLGRDEPLSKGIRFFDQVQPHGALAALEGEMQSLLTPDAAPIARDFTFDSPTPKTLHADAEVVGSSGPSLIVLTLEDVGEEREAAELRERNQAFLLHDLKAPLWSVLINLPLALDSLPPGEAREAVEDAIVETERMRRMVNNLQDLHRSDSGALTIKKAPTDVVKIAREAIDSATRASEMQGIDLELDGPPWRMAEVDELLVRRLFDNLIGNALRFARTVVRVTVEEGEPLVVRVADDGQGIPKEQRERIFERFARAANPGGRGDNAGLGLTFCRIVAQGHGGDIRAEEAEGGGAEFVVTLG